jgi:hypothetical protein
MGMRGKGNSTGNRQFMPTTRKAYEQGASVRYLRRKYDMSQSELEDCCPEEFGDEATVPDSDIGGY